MPPPSAPGRFDPPPALAHALRDDLHAAGYTVDGVADLIGARAHAALLRNRTVPADVRTRGGSPLETLVRLFVLQRDEPADAVRTALPTSATLALDAGLLGEAPEGRVRALLDCRPYAAEDAAGASDLWVVSDLTPGLDGAPVRVDADHVLGIGRASTSLAELTVREPVASALDLGTGCGVQALHLARHAERVVATDVNPRALDVTRFNLALNGLAERVEVRDGSLFEPVAGERFDLVVTNPPFVINPPGAEVLTYRDSGFPGDEVVERIVREATDHLTEGGWCEVLANWAVLDGVAWDERLAGWLPADCDALVVQREVLDPAAYVELWLDDAGVTGRPDAARRYEEWLGWLDTEGVAGIGFGWIGLHRTGGAGGRGPVRRELLDHPYEVEQPIGPAVAAWGRARPGDVGADSRLWRRVDVVQETHGPPGVDDPASIVLRQQTGLRRARRVDTVEAALVGASDGDLTVGQILDAVAELTGLDPAAVRQENLPRVADLVAEGFLVDDPPTA